MQKSVAPGPLAPSSDVVVSRLIKWFSVDRELTQEDLETLQRLPYKVGRNRRHEVLARPPHDAEEVFLVLGGCIYESLILKGGEQQIVDWFAPGDLTSFGCHGEFNVVAGDDCEVAIFRRCDLTAAVTRSPALLWASQVQASRDLKRMKQRLVAAGRQSALSGVAGFTLESFERLLGRPATNGDCVRLPLKQMQIADLLGLTGIHVNRMFRELKNRGIIAEPAGELLLLDVDTLRTLAGSD